MLLLNMIASIIIGFLVLCAVLQVLIYIGLTFRWIGTRFPGGLKGFFGMVIAFWLLHGILTS